MRNRIRKVLSALVQSLRPGRKFIDLNFHGRNIRVLKGTVRTTVDKDDAWYACLVQNARVIFDVGANVGYTVFLANLYGKPDRVVLLDANVNALGIAFNNLTTNDMGLNCLFYRAFVGGRDNENIKFYTVGSGAAGSMYTSHARTASAINSYFYVKTITLDWLSLHLKVVPDFVKIDVEGAEYFVLQGAMDIGRKQQTKLFVEMHSTKEVPMIENARRVLEWCGQVGYNAYYLKEHVLLTDPGYIKHRGKCHLLLLPASMSYPDALRTINEGSPLPRLSREQ